MKRPEGICVDCGHHGGLHYGPEGVCVADCRSLDPLIQCGCKEFVAPMAVVSGGAIAGAIDALGGASGAIVITITDHEIMDMAISGQAYSLDGKYNFRNESRLLTEDKIFPPKVGSVSDSSQAIKEKDPGAGLIHQIASPLAETLPRPIFNQIICAAIKLSDGTIIRGHRHDGCFKYAEQMGIRTPERFRGHVQGFIDARNQFVDRKEAMRIQLAAGIPTADARGRGGYHEGNGLFSEDLY